MMLGGDFNIRIGEEGNVRNWNGFKQRDEEGEYTYVGARGNTIIDYVIVNEETNYLIKEFRVESLPLRVRAGWRDEEGSNVRKKREIISWSEEGRKIFEEETKALELSAYRTKTANERG